MSALRLTFLIAALGAALLGAARAQVVIGGGAVIGGNVLSEAAGPFDAPPAEPDAAGSQVLDFVSGERLHGALNALDVAGGWLTWRRPDASGVLDIPLVQVRGLRNEAPAPVETPTLSTIKFTGGDWLTAEVLAIQGEKIQLRLRDGARVTTERAHVEWIYFSPSGAAECYDGPTSLAGWVSAGAWIYRDGALRATAPTPISRMFATLPDQVEYRMTLDQGEIANAFSLMLRGRTMNRATNRAITPGTVTLTMRASSLQLWAGVNGNFRSVSVDLTELLGAPGTRAKGPLRLRVFDDFTGGRLLVYINERKVAEWAVDPGATGKNGGGLQFQPTSWSGEKEQTLANIKVLPWDGREPGDETPAEDLAVLAKGGLKNGRVVSWNGRTLRIGDSTIPHDELRMLRFRRPENPPEDAAPIAHVRLRGGGEFDATGLDWRDGRIAIRTNFGGEIAVAPTSVAGLDFPRMETPPPVNDVLVFRNGDRVRGALVAMQGGDGVHWRLREGGPPVEFAPGNISSVLFAARPPGPPATTVVRFRNGDWLGGTFLSIDAEHVVLEAAEVGPLRLPRSQVKTLYFGSDAPPAVSDGVSDHEIWERGLNLNATSSRAARPGAPEVGSPWTYAAGTFTLAQPGRTALANLGNGLQLGRIFETLAPRVEVNFTVTAERSPVFFTAQLFTEAANRGYMMHCSTVGLSIYDMVPRPGGRGIVQQQFPFGDAMKHDARERHVRVLADRTTGRMTVLVDGWIAARLAPKPADGPRALGRGVILAPQSALGCTFSNLWVGPWNGRLPDAGLEMAAPTIALANGDEVEGTVEGGTSALLKIASEVGPIELPSERVTMIDFGGSPVERPGGTRLHLAGQGALTVTAWRIEKTSLIGRSELCGELTLPLTAVQEIAFAPLPATAAR